MNNFKEMLIEARYTNPGDNVAKELKLKRNTKESDDTWTNYTKEAKSLGDVVGVMKKNGFKEVKGDSHTSKKFKHSDGSDGVYDLRSAKGESLVMWVIRK